ncbi:gamma-aminobutyric acid receptor subunit pi isoform X1 [Choloepus didactylus]|uniref:gamma-aminobutyric acid receptor subunit pi isoform X1 n=1 Tax=Choloepus didactylus TaxID=27675 RepID=UPI00189D6AE2|nr:gamma-aminobutyric acid receptor subunit pi isoform X1 [Choloepus didactylus]XP_037655266.1 gamma-aminobutyric acid receptor subunit pi isoform X1 [Choloepus didactylus]
MSSSLPLIFLCLSLFTQRMCVQGSHFNIEVSRSDKLSLPGFENLTAGYNKFLRPNFGGEPVQIALTLDIASISSISESNMDYTATIYLRQRWTDPRLVFEGNKSFTLDARLVEFLWVPDTYIVESKTSFLHEVTVGNRLIRLFSNGTVLYALRITTTVACNMDLSKYPMDTQTCKLQLESWGYDGNDVEFTWLRGNDSVRGLENLRLAQYTIQRYFTLVTRSQQETGNYTRLVLQFELRRNVLYFILETYVPSTFLVVLSWVSFWISLDSVPARTCIGVTTVLSMTTLMIGARTSLPNTNCFIKAIDVYLGICFSFVFGALLEYAIAHYSSLQQMAAKDRNGMHQTPQSHEGKAKEVEEVNITNIINSSISSFKRKISFAGIEISGDNVDYSNLTMKTSDKFKFVFRDKMGRIVDYFTIQNPSNVDRYSKLLFPLIFMLANVFYWAYYMYF